MWLWKCIMSLGATEPKWLQSGVYVTNKHISNGRSPPEKSTFVNSSPWTVFITEGIKDNLWDTISIFITRYEIVITLTNPSQSRLWADNGHPVPRNYGWPLRSAVDNQSNSQLEITSEDDRSLTQNVLVMSFCICHTRIPTLVMKLIQNCVTIVFLISNYVCLSLIDRSFQHLYGMSLHVSNEYTCCDFVMKIGGFITMLWFGSMGTFCNQSPILCKIYIWTSAENWWLKPARGLDTILKTPKTTQCFLCQVWMQDLIHTK